MSDTFDQSKGDGTVTLVENGDGTLSFKSATAAAAAAAAALKLPLAGGLMTGPIATRTDMKLLALQGSTGTPVFNAWVSTSPNGYGDTEPDQVFRAGWNYNSGSGQVDANFGAVGFSIESYFRKAAGGTAKVQEFHFEHVMKGGTYRRYISMEGNQETGELSLSLKATDGELTFNSPDGLTNYGYFGTDVKCAAGSFLTATYGAVSLKQTSFAGSTTVPLIMLDTSAVDGSTHDTVQIGRGAPAWLEVLKPQHNNDLLLMLAGNGKGIYFDTVASGYRIERDAGGLAIGANSSGAVVGMYNGATLVAQFSGGGLDLRPGMILDLSPIGATDPVLKVTATSDTPTGASATYMKVLVGSTPFYIALKAAS